MQRFIIGLSAVLLALFIFACSAQPNVPEPGAGVTPTQEPTGEPSSTVIDRARQALSEQLGRALADVMVVSSTEMTWSDSCFGLGGPAESCALALTPGHEVRLIVDGQEYVYRSNEDGSQLRLEQQLADDTLPVDVIARRRLAEHLGINFDQIDVVDVTPMDWSDSCFGLGGPAESCLQAIFAGYQVHLSVDGKAYVYRTNEDGSQLRLDEQLVDESQPAIVAARRVLAQHLGIAEELITVIGSQPMEWSDGCLGLGGPAEACLLATTPGYEVRLADGAIEYEVRTDLDGSQVRLGSPFVDDTVAAVVAAQRILAEQLGVAVEQVTVVDVAPMAWSDGCLGLGGPAESCLLAITPGFEVRMSANGETFVFRTDRAGEQVRQAEPLAAAQDLDNFINELALALKQQDNLRLQQMMADPFALGLWRSEWQIVDPATALKQISFSELSFQQLANESNQMLDGINPFEMHGPDVNVVAVLHATGWNGSGNALLYIVEQDGAYSWHALLYTPDKF